MASAVAGRTAFLFTVTDPFSALLCGSTDRDAVPGKSQMVRVDQSFMDRNIQELLSIEPKNRKKIERFQAPAFQQGKESGSHEGRIAGSLIAFLLPFGGFILGKRSLGERLPKASSQMREKKS